MGLFINNDPFAGVLHATENLYPGIATNIQFRPDMKYRRFLWFRFGRCGCTTFPKDGGVPLIDISTNIPFTAMVEVLAHELAHVVAGEAAGHGAAWQDAFGAIHQEYGRLMNIFLEESK